MRTYRIAAAIAGKPQTCPHVQMLGHMWEAGIYKKGFNAMLEYGAATWQHANDIHSACYRSMSKEDSDRLVSPDIGADEFSALMAKYRNTEHKTENPEYEELWCGVWAAVWYLKRPEMLAPRDKGRV